MREYMELGSTPCDEDCAQVGSDNYAAQAHKETRAYMRQLWRVLGKDKRISVENAPESFQLVVKSYPHDFGTYHEVAARFDDNNEAAMELAYWLEEHSPANWDEVAKKELIP